jgi:feruloyl-CoA synthase
LEEDAMTAAAARIRSVRFGELHAERREGRGGVIYVRSLDPLGAFARSLTDRLRHWAGEAPDRVFLADRADDGSWRTITYAQAWARIRPIAQALLDAGLSAERPLAILSGNEIEHALLGFAAMLAGIPYCPISPNYALLSSDYGKLRHIFGLLEPGLIYASDGARFAPAVAATAPDVPMIVRRNPVASAILFEDFEKVTVTPRLDAADAAVGPDTVAKLLFTSGSTGAPKGVITTQCMLCCNQQMIRQALAFLGDAPPVLCDWMPWHHVAGGSHNVGIALYNGGSFYIDDGIATPQGIGRTVRTLSEVAPTVYFNVPKGYELLAEHFASNTQLRQTFFSKLKLMQYAGAGLSQHVFDALDRAALDATGERILMITGYGSTETAPFAFTTAWPVERAGTVGLPAAGLEVKLVPNAEKLELRLRGPSITPGYWKDPERTTESFDDEGYYMIGDALRFVDPDDLSRGFLFDGRVSEDFKLATGTWVNAGGLRNAIIATCAPLVRDAVLTGLDRNFVGALIFPNTEACAALGDEAAVKAAFEQRLASLAAKATGSSNHVARAIILAEPPSADAGEVTDKGSINQRAVLTRRAQLVGDLYAEPPPPHVMTFSRGGGK